jgi:L-asparaginase II
MLLSPKHVPLAIASRGGHPELIHIGSIAVVDHTGALIHGVGDPESLNFTRSALKPIQALPFVEDGGMSRFNFTSHELALMCASHNGEAIHVSIAKRMLAAVEANEGDLQCGCHPPTYFSATHEQMGPRVRWNQLHHNCSGKHAGFLAYCRLHGWSIAEYLDPDAPAQRHIRKAVQLFAPGIELPMGIDGCGAPNYAMPLTRLAHAFVQLATGATPALAAIVFAMTRHPDLVSGTARADLALMQTAPDDWVTKVGADGVQAIGVKSKGIGIAIRVADGNARALHAVTVEVLQQLGLLDDPSRTPLARYARPAIVNYRGTVTGRVEPVFRLAS